MKPENALIRMKIYESYSGRTVLSEIFRVQSRKGVPRVLSVDEVLTNEDTSLALHTLEVGLNLKV